MSKSVLFIALFLTPLLIHTASPPKRRSLSPYYEYTLPRFSCYRAVKGQCDSRPFETASGYIIKKRYIRKNRICAISRELREKLGIHWGQKIIVITPSKRYLCRVIDHTGLKIKDCIDLLIDEKEKQFIFRNVKILIYVKTPIVQKRLDKVISKPGYNRASIF